MGAALCCCGGRVDSDEEDEDLIASVSEAPPSERDEPLPNQKQMICNNGDSQRGHCEDTDDEEDEDENCCPTCFEEYTADNPKIVAKCDHHYHLPCIFAWLERSNLCPACSRVMEFESL